MIGLLSALLTLLTVCAWALASYVTFDLPVMLLRLIQGQPWGQQAWWQGIVEWFLFPILFLLQYAVIWIIIRLVFGAPRDTLRRLDWHVDTEIDPRQQGHLVFRDRIWNGLFHLLVLRLDKTWPFPYWAALAMSLTGLVVATLAVIAAILPEPVYSGRSHLSFPVIMVLVIIGICRTHRELSRQIDEAQTSYDEEANRQALRADKERFNKELNEQDAGKEGLS